MKMVSKVWVVVLSLLMFLSVTPQVVFAGGSSPERYEETASMETLVRDAEVHVYVTKNGGTVSLTASNYFASTFPMVSGYRQYTATPADGWIWNGWTFEQFFEGEDRGNRHDLLGYSFSNSGSDWKTPYDGTGMTISVNRLNSIGEIVGKKITYNIYANFNPTIAAAAGDGGTITDPGTTEVEYGGNKEYTVTADAGKKIDAVTVDGQKVSTEAGATVFTYPFNNVTEPHTIEATFTDVLYCVTYTDGVDGEEIFADQTYPDLISGTATPRFQEDPKREDYVFMGWDPLVTDTVTETVVYKATWAEDKNHNGIPDVEEEKYTVTYEDGVDTEEIFADQIYSSLLSGEDTPEFQGDLKCDGYVFTGWEPAVQATVTESVNYIAQWAADENGNGIPDSEEEFTVSYQFVSGTDGKDLPKEITDMIPADQTEKYGAKVIPAVLGNESVKGTDGVWSFNGWDPAAIDKLTQNMTFKGTWKFSPNAVAINVAPVIRAEDKTITVGDAFDPRKDVTATDTEDGDLTGKIQITANTVDTSRAGTYTVTYRVTDKDGASTAKTITVTVKAGNKDNNKDSNKDNNKDKKDNENPSAGSNGSGGGSNKSAADHGDVAVKSGVAVKTGDTANVLLWTVLVGLSFVAVIAVLVRCKKNMHRK